MPIIIGPSGGAGGDAFADSLPDDAFISSITMSYSSVLNSVAITYSVPNGESQTLQHGTVQGDTQTLRMVTDENVMSVSGTYGQKIDSLTITTTLGGEITFNGGGGEADFQYMVPSNGNFCGFSGRSDGSQLVALGIVMKQGQSSSLHQMPCICMGPAGGCGGKPFIDAPIPLGGQVRSVKVSHGDEVLGIGFTYQINNSTQVIPIHGNANGDSVDTFELNAGEWITGISGKYDNHINSLVIQTNKRKSQMYGGSGGSVQFNFELTTSCDVVGFVGRADAALDSIGIVGREEGRLPPMSVPVYRFVDSRGAHYYSTSATAPPSGYTVEDAVFHAFSTRVSGTQPVYRLRQASSNFYYYSFDSLAPSDGNWINEGVAWYMFAAADTLGAAVSLVSYAAGDQWFYATATAADNTAGYTNRGAIGKVFNLPAPIYRFTNGSLHYYSRDSSTVPSGYSSNGPAFFAFSEAVFDTLPVYRYLNRTTNAHAYVFRPEDLPQGNWGYEEIAWYAYPPASPASGTKALSLYINNASGDFLYTANPAAETLTGYSLLGAPMFVFAAMSDFTGIKIPDRVVICGADCLYESYNIEESGVNADQPFCASVHWYGLVIKINQETTTSIINGSAMAATLTSLIGLAIQAVFPAGPNPLAVMAGIIAGVLFAVAGVLAFVNKGNGVYLTIYWPAFVLPPPLTGMAIPTAV